MWLLKLLALLPLVVLYRIADVLYLFICYLTPYRKPEVLKHLSNSFPNKSEAEIQALAKAFYRNIADVIVESIKAIRISEEELKRRVRITNPEVLKPWVDENKSIIFMAAHQCNWEWLLLASCAKLPMPMDAVYKPLHYKPGDELMYNIRSRFGARPIPVKQTMMEMMKRRNELRGFAFVADQSPLVDEEKYWANFLHQDSAFPVGVDKIARMTKYPVFYVAMKRLQRGYYEVSLHLLAEPPYAKSGYEITEAYVHQLEQEVLAAPAYWLWSYRKWKYKKPIYE